MEAANKILNALEVAEKIEMGLCFFCDEVFTVEHQLMHKNIQICVVENDEEEPEQEGEDRTLNFSFSSATTTAAPSETLFPSNSSFSDPFSFDLPKASDDGTKKTEVDSVADPASNISEVLDRPDPASSIFSDPTDTDFAAFVGSKLLTAKSIDTKTHSRNPAPPLAIVKSFDLLEDVADCAVVVLVIRIGSFDPGPSLPIHVHFFHSSQLNFPLSATLNTTKTPPPEPPDGAAFPKLPLALPWLKPSLNHYIRTRSYALAKQSKTAPYDPGPLDSPPPAKVHLNLVFPNFQFSLNSEDDNTVSPASFTLVAGNMVFSPLVNIDPYGGGTMLAVDLEPNDWGVNVQPYSCSSANFVVFTGLLHPGNRIMGLDSPSNGHLSFGYYTLSGKKVSVASIFFETLAYKVNHLTGYINYDKLEKKTVDYRPKILICDGRFRKFTDKCGSILMCDKSKKNHNQSCWIWQKKKLSVLNFVDKGHENHKLHSVNGFVVDLEHNQHLVLQDSTCLMQISTRTQDLIVDILQLCTHIGTHLRDVFKDPYEIHLKIAECFPPRVIHILKFAISSVVLVDALFHLANFSGLSRQLVLVIDFFVEATNQWSIVISNADTLGVRELIFLASNLTVSLFLLLPNLAKGRRLLEPEILIETLINELKRHGTWCVYGIFLHATGACDQHTHSPVSIYPKLCVTCFGSGSVFHNCKFELQLAMPSLPLSSVQKKSYSTHINKTLRECKVLVFLIGASVGVWVGLCTTSYFLLLMVVQVATIRKRATVVNERLVLWCYGLGLATTQELEQLIANYMAMVTLDVAAYHGEIGATAGQVALLLRKMINRGRARVPPILLKWKTLPLKHGTSKYSSLRTRIF